MLKQENNTITIGNLTMSLDFFREQEPDYSLPQGAIGVTYIPDTLHIISYSDRVEGAEMPWTEGNSYLSKVEQYKVAWEATQVPTLEQVKAQKMTQLNATCKAEILAGFESDALGSPHRYSAEMEDQLNLIGSTLAGIDTPYVCTDSEGVKAARLHTAAQMSQVYQDGATIKGTKIFWFHELRALVEAAETIEAVNLINW